MAIRYVLPGIFLLLAAIPAIADTYYIVQDKQTKKCTVVKEKPKADTLIGIDLLGLEFKTQVEAEQGAEADEEQPGLQEVPRGQHGLTL